MLPVYFDPSDTRPHLLVNREKELAWLEGRLSDYLKRNEESRYTGRSFAVIGNKGIGKTIMAEAALDRIKKSQLGASALFLLADCRRLRGRREVLTQVAQAAVQELNTLWQINNLDAKLGSLLDTAKVLRTLCNFNADVELKVVHEHLVQFKRAVDLSGRRSFLANLSVNFGVSLERIDKRQQELVGKIKFDEARLCRAFCDFFHDVREQGMHVVLHLDNIDELRHEYYQEEEVRKDVDGILALRDAPIGLLLSMRTYYAGSLPREVTQRLLLNQLKAADLQTVVLQRVADSMDDGTRHNLQKALSEVPLRDPAERLASMARTPLSYLLWSQFLYDHMDQPLSVVLQRFLETHYSNIPASTLRKLVRRFLAPDQPLPLAEVLAACDGNQAIYNQLLDRQAVLPQDFWHPVDFTLDPELDFLFWMEKGQG
jgi:hypothetical protein